MTGAGLRVTDLAGGKHRTLPTGPDRGYALCAALTRHGLRVVVMVGGTTIDLLDEAGQTLCRAELPGARGFGPVTVSPDGKRLARLHTDGGRTRLVVFDSSSCKQTAVCDGHRDGIWAAAFSPDGTRLASGGEDRVASLSCDRGLGLGEGDDTVRVWDVDPGATLPALRGHNRAVYPVAVSPDGRWIASGSWDRTVRLWDAATGKPCATLPHPGVVLTLAYATDGSWLVTSTDADDRLRIWDTATGRGRKEIQTPAWPVRNLTVSPDGKRVAATAFDPRSSRHRLFVYDIGSGDPLSSADCTALAYSPDGRWLAARAADETTVLLLDARTHETVAQLRGHEKSIWSAAFSPDSRRLATCSTDHTVRLWEVDGGACRVLRGHTDDVFAAAFHPDGRRLATGGRDRAVWLWDLERGEAVARLTGHRSYVWSLAFSPDGATLASGSGDTTVGLWDTAPLETRYRARREAATLRPEAERLVGRLWRQAGDPARAVEAVRADRSLGEPLRQAALRAVLRRVRPSEVAPGIPFMKSP